MHTCQRLFTWSAAALSFVVGLVFVLNGSAAGWVLFIIGISYLWISTPPGEAWAASNPGLVRWGLVGVTLLLILLVVVIGAVLLFK